MSNAFSPVIPGPVAISPAHFQSMIANGRSAYVRSVHLTRSMNADRRPQFPARQKAHLLGLAVNTDKASRCPQREVSVVPLPIVIQDVVDEHSFNGVPIIRAPVPRRHQLQKAETVPASMPVINRPAAPRPRPLPLPPVSVPNKPSPMDVPMDESEDENEESFEQIILSPMDESSSQSSSASSSSGLLTPEDAYTPVVLRVKRRFDSTAEMDYTFEKRPRYERTDDFFVHGQRLVAPGQRF